MKKIKWFNVFVVVALSLNIVLTVISIIVSVVFTGTVFNNG